MRFTNSDMGRRFADLEPHLEAQLSLGLFANVDDVLGARHIHGHGLLAIDVLPCRHDGFQVMRMEVGRSRDEDEIHFFRCCDFLVGIGALEELRGIDGRVALRLLMLIKVFSARLKLIGEEIRQGHHARVGVVNETRSHSRAASPTPRIPRRKAEFASAPRTAPGLRIMAPVAVAAAAPRNVLRLITPSTMNMPP